ncbi:MAG: hypothetical protein ACRCXN_12955 [Bacteroidales bacterium]
MENLESVNSQGVVTKTDLQVQDAIIGVDFVKSIANAMEALKNGKFERGLSIAGAYYEFSEKGDSVQGIFAGIKTIYKNEGGTIKPIHCASWFDAEGKLWLNGGAAFISNFSTFAIGQMFEATFVEAKKNGKNGVTKLFNIVPLYEVE